MNSIPRLSDYGSSGFLPSVHSLQPHDKALPPGTESFAEVLSKLSAPEGQPSRPALPQQQLLVAVHVDALRGAQALIAAQQVSELPATETARAVPGTGRVPELTPALSALAQVEQARQLAAQVAVQQAARAQDVLTPRAVRAAKASAAIQVSMSAADTPSINVLVQLSASASKLSNLLKLKQAEAALELLSGEDEADKLSRPSGMAAAAAVAFYRMVSTLDRDRTYPVRVSVRA